MSKRVKAWLIAATSLILVGCILFAGVMTVLKWDFKKLTTIRYTTKTHTVTEPFVNVSVKADSVADVTILPSKDGVASVVCCEQENLAHTVSVEGDTLTIEVNDTRKWYQHIGIGSGNTAVTVYLPVGTYGDLTVKTSTGDVSISEGFTFAAVDVAVSTGHITCAASAVGEMKLKASTGDIRLADATAGSVSLSVSTGKVAVSSVACGGEMKVTVSTGDATLADVTCGELSSSGSTGDLTLKKVVATADFTIKRSTGNVTLDACDAATLTITTTTGDVKGSLLTEKVFVTSTDTGTVRVPESIHGGKCKITTDTGDIHITLV